MMYETKHSVSAGGSIVLIQLSIEDGSQQKGEEVMNPSPVLEG